MESPPPIPRPARQHARRKSLQGPSASNRVHIQPASPEVISSLITSLSIISSPANALFESQSNPATPSATRTPFNPASYNHSDRGRNGGRVGGSFGIDYGAFDQPSLRDLQEEESLDELAASAPVIRTAKPPSGLSPLTAPPKSPGRESTSLKTFLRGSSRPSSKGSSGSKDRDDVISIGNLSIEPGSPQPKHELRRQRSSDSWGRKQARNQKGLMYMSSKERLREKEQERKRATGGAVGGSTKGGDRIPLPHFDSETFMGESVITEEPPTPKESSGPEGSSRNAVASSSKAAGSTIGRDPSLRPGSQGGIGSGRFIPARDSSLRNRESSRKRTSQRSSRQSSKARNGEDADIIHEADEEKEKKRDKSRRTVQPSEAALKMMEPLDNLDMLHSKRPARGSREVAPASKMEQLKVVEDDDEGAPSPAVAQRRSRASPSRGDRSSSQKRMSGASTPDPTDDSKPKRSSSRLKRLSAPLSPREKDSSRNSLSGVASPEPTKPQIHVDDRPTSADSIDDAVEAYMCSPRLSQKIRHPQTGRTISFSEVGDSEGFAVFCCVGMGLTRFITAFYDELALTLKLRLITPDRPGVGDSEPYNDGTATPLSWPDDVYAICQALKITKFSILAHSAGAIYALATALRMPQHIRGRIHLLAPWIPPSQMNVFGAQNASPPTNSIPTSQRILRALPTPILKAANSSFMSATSSSITSSLPRNQKRNKRKSSGRDTPAPIGKGGLQTGADKENHGRNSTVYPNPSEPGALERAARDPTDPNNEAAILAAAASTLADKERQMTYDTRLTHAIWDLATSGANPAVDLLVCLERRHTIGFRYVDITRAVVIHHGSKDTRVPVDNVRWLGKTMKRCEVRVLEGEGHGLMASATVMGGVLMEIAREWEDWVRVTGQNVSKDGARRTLRERASVGAFR